MLELDDEQRAHWRAHRYVCLEGALQGEELAALCAAADTLGDWPETPGKWMKYFEPGEERRLCRVENFLPYHDALRALLERPDLLAVLGELFAEPAVLFKEKLNFKLQGGEGFAPHQDAPAFTSFGQDYHITLMLGADATTVENGCLELVDGYCEREILPLADDATIRRDVASQLCWRPLETQPGDAVLFDSYVPHRSGRNRSSAPRRALYVTYNAASQGRQRDAYFALKRRVFPPECERDADAPLDPASRVFNVGNPIR